MYEADVLEADDNDVYFMDIINDKIVMNDNYHGILVYDENFQLIKKIELFHDFIVDFALKGKDGILLFCYDEHVLVYFMIESLQCKMFSLKKFSDWIFSSLYVWDDEFVLLSDYNGNIIRLDLKNEKLAVETGEGRLKRFEKVYQNLRGLEVCKNLGAKKSAFISEKNGMIELIKYTQGSENGFWVLYDLKEEQFHDFDFERHYISAVGEEETHIIDMNKGQVQKCFADVGWFMIRGNFMVKNEEVFYFLLEGNKSEQLKMKIRKLGISFS